MSLTPHDCHDVPDVPHLVLEEEEVGLSSDLQTELLAHALLALKSGELESEGIWVTRHPAHVPLPTSKKPTKLKVVTKFHCHQLVGGLRSISFHPILAASKTLPLVQQFLKLTFP